ncbi:hypothetical protein Ancab_006111 [Ancistrocladus abbreviatus]
MIVMFVNPCMLASEFEKWNQMGYHVAFSMCIPFPLLYDMKLLSVDIPMASGTNQCLFLIGDGEGYRIGGGLVAELREPVVKAMAATKEFEQVDEIEEEEDAEREL